MFPSWFNQFRTVIVLAVILAPIYVSVVMLYGLSPWATDVGYRPQQPLPFSHALHAGKLGMDCRYCHVNVERAAQATVPTTSICMNCHQKILGESPKLAVVRQSFATGMPVHWVRVHDLPDFVYFDHRAHVRRGVGCVSCHGRIDQMDEGGSSSRPATEYGLVLGMPSQSNSRSSIARSNHGNGSIGTGEVPALHVSGPRRCETCVFAVSALHRLFDLSPVKSCHRAIPTRQFLNSPLR